jgi:hypothetical protein
MLAAGASYSEVSRWALRVTATNRTRRKHVTGDDERLRSAHSTADVEPVEPVPLSAVPAKVKRNVSEASKASRNSWHIAADWVEAFGPALYLPIDEQLRTDALAERARLDGLRADGSTLDRPQVILVDDVPVYGRDLDRKGRSRRDAGYFVLVVAELHWPTRVIDDDPFMTAAPSSKLRLVRAMAKSNTAAWRLVFHELGYEPDFVVADAGSGIAAAIRAHFDPAHTKFIPSLWHLAQKVELALADVPGAVTVGPSGRELMPPLRDHVRMLSRTSGVLASTVSWAKWWDDLLAILATHRLAADDVLSRRKSYEAAMAAVLADLTRFPGVPVSTGGLETLIARQVTPLLAMRRTSFGNIERTNLLFDLVVARQHGAFDNLGEVAKLLRYDTEAHDGWTVPLRAVSDPRPRGGSYSSLRDTTLLSRLAKREGLT